MGQFPNKDTQFSSSNQPLKNGRKRKIYTILKEKGYNSDDVKTAFGELAFYTLKELQELHEDESKPIITRIVANQFYQALSKSDWGKVREILEHVIGKPIQAQTIDHTTNGEKITWNEQKTYDPIEKTDGSN